MTVSGHQQHSDWERQRERLSAYLDSELGEHERATLEQHLPTCEACRQTLEELRQTRALLRSVPLPVLPRSFRLPETGAVPQSIAGGGGTTLAGYRAVRTRTLQWIGGMVAVLGLFILIATVLQSPHGSESAASSLGAAPRANSVSTSPTTSLTRAPSYTSPIGASASQSSGRATQVPLPATSTPTQFGSSESSAGESGTPLPLGVVAGAALAIGGASFFVTGTVLLRRRSPSPSLRAPKSPSGRMPES